MGGRSLLHRLPILSRSSQESNSSVTTEANTDVLCLLDASTKLPTKFTNLELTPACKEKQNGKKMSIKGFCLIF